MKPPYWKDVAELIGITAIVTSLIFVGMQLRQEEQIALSQISQADEASSTQIDLAIVENAEIWLQSNSGDPLNEAEQLIMNRLVSALYRRRNIVEILKRRARQKDPPGPVNSILTRL